ncbi:uncharacterized protein LOC117173705 [Belonocnema kinseyi]|uniref:uncharacterized protein LOC117173705 n=1 Tax=Belonocnema kinseyi TaxID=2817044 RepID=UPI00143D77C2|nr:uncharacterized protein LOC117173705 [Belonocnema kinseyi]
MGGLEKEVYREGEREGVQMRTVKIGGVTITLMKTAYKVYAMMLVDRLQKDVEGKGILPETLAGFMEGRHTIDSIYVLQHVVDIELAKKGVKVHAFFVDLKGAFPSVDRERSWEAMEERGVKGPDERVKEVYKET